jgi:hypothetical protein
MQRSSVNETWQSVEALDVVSPKRNEGTVIEHGGKKIS